MDNKGFTAFCVSLKTEHNEKRVEKISEAQTFGSQEFIIWTFDQDKHKMSENIQKE